LGDRRSGSFVPAGEHPQLRRRSPWRKQNSGYVGSPLHFRQLIQGVKIVQMIKILKKKKSVASWTKNAWQGQEK
jgi:hypothetical protein